MWVFAPIAVALLLIGVLLWTDRDSITESTRDSSGGGSGSPDPDANVDTQPEQMMTGKAPILRAGLPEQLRPSSLPRVRTSASIASTPSSSVSIFVFRLQACGGNKVQWTRLRGVTL